MNLDRQLARLLAAVIVMIAAVFGASAVQAHEGHHHAPATVTIQPVAPAPVAAEAMPLKASPVVVASAFDSPQSVVVLSVSAKPGAKAPAERPCNGVCCSMGASCCVPGILLSTILAPVDLTGGSRLLFAEQPAGPGLAREALPKPPRSFA
ncbi:hypothetical protein [Methylorubrum extorquens]|uniref:hypothetical protein n=1 Tax=Methylorubrum extorquens TaxID=408 RepID=UPI0009D72767|nr:hypothetical protein [Methylorubrum extorquens]